MVILDQFLKQKYINLETFRRSGESMKTPVWFVQDDKAIYVQTVANSGKVKRIRNNGQVNIALCLMNGKLVSKWNPARAREVTDPEVSLKVNQLLDRKYGLIKKLFENQRAQKRGKQTILEIILSE